MAELLLTGLFVAILGAVPLVSPYLIFLDRTPRSIWLSIAGGVAVSYVLIHLLPELASKAAALEGSVLAHEQGLFSVALVGMVGFYGLERLARVRSGNAHGGRGGFWLHVTAFAIYNFLIGYLLRPEAGQEVLPDGALYTLAMGLHFLVNDRALFAHHGRIYLARGRWILAAAAPLGWAASFIVHISDFWSGVLFGLLAGGIILNIIKEELPAERESRFWAFALGSAGYAGLLLAV